MKRLFPMFVKLDGRRVLVVGAGRVGEAKVRGLLDTGARIKVVALQASHMIKELAKTGAIVLEQRAVDHRDFDGIFLVIAATSSRALNEFISAEAQRRKIPCNVVDVPELCDFFYPAVVRRGELQIAISTSGQSPLLAQRIRKQLEEQFGPEWAGWVAHLGQVRREVRCSRLPAERKKELLKALFDREQLKAAWVGNSKLNPESEST